MVKGAKSKSVAVGLIFAFLAFYFPGLLEAKSSSTGSMIGFVFENDGTSPLEGAVVVVKNVSTGSMFKSTSSDSYGVFKIGELEQGIYVMGVSTQQGNYNSSELIGIQANSTAKVSIALTSYDERTAAAAAEVTKEQKIEGESLIGRIVSYNASNQIAEVFMIKGFMQLDDRIHVKGEVTDFYQDVKTLNFEGNAVKRVFAGQTITLNMKYACETNDLVYLVCKRGIVPLFLLPAGIAAIVAGGAGIISLIDNPPTTSEFRKK